MSISSLTTYNPPRHFRPTYEALLMRCLNSDSREVNARTGAGIRMLGPVSFVLDLSRRELPVCGIRKTFPRTAAAEVAWFLMGTKDVSWLKRYAPIWDKFVEADGVTIDAAYGFRWATAFGRNQLKLGIAALAMNPTDRRVYVANWDPRSDGLGAEGQKNVPCPLGFTLSIQDGRLNSTLTLRSSDVFVGLPYDVMGHALLMDAVAAELDVGLGEMMVCLAHPHLYEVHVQEAWDALGGGPSDSTMVMPGWSVSMIEKMPEAYVSQVAVLAKPVKQPEYHTRPEVVK